jgi:nicotinamidase-related amidase
MSLDLNPATTALVLIDLQKGILGRQLAPHSSAKVIENAAALGRRFAEVHALVVRVKVSFSANAADRLTRPVDSPMPAPPGGLPADFAEFVPEIASLSAEVTITKRQWGAFYGTELDLQLRRRGISTIVLGGVATNFGVESTAREAWEHNYAVVIAEDACSTMSPEIHRFAIETIFPRIARVRSTAEIIGSIQPMRT